MCIRSIQNRFSRGRNSRNRKKRRSNILSRKKKTLIWITVGIAVAVLLYILFSNIGGAKELNFTQLLSLIEKGKYVAGDKVIELDVGEKITDIYLDAYQWTLVTSKGAKYTAIGPSMYDAYGLQVIESFISKGINMHYADPNAGSIWSSLLPLGGTLLLGLLFFFMLRGAASGGGPNMNMNKSKTQVQNHLKVRFSDVAGAEEEKEELQEIVEFLKAPKKFSNLGARIPSGVLLVGPPGTGKTLFAKAVAGEAGVPFFSVSGSDFVEMYVGVGAKRVRDLFDMAKKSQPCIIFIDEIDAVGRRRGAGLGGGHDEREQTLNQILVQMDGFESNEGIIIMAATNRADILDPALLRPGRFDRQINVNLPDVKGREQILKVHARNKPMEADVNFKTVARITAGFSGAELANLLNEAAILAARKGKKLIGNLELYDGINKVLMGPQKKSRVVTESDKRCTAYHEAGHAVLACLCKHCDPVHEVSIIPRGRAAGYTMTRPETDDNDVSYNKLIDNICMSLGGRVAEELVIQDVTTGASADLQHVSEIARRMVTQWGMSDKLGLVAYDSDQPVFMGMEYGHQGRGGYSQETAATIDAEIRRLITEAHERAVKLLKENRSILDNMSRVLVEKETIYTEEVQMLMDGMSYLDVIAEMEKKEGQHEANPFARVTPVSSEHEVLSEEEKADLPKAEEPVEDLLEEETVVEEDTTVEETPEETTSSDED
ncbi:MAG: ATP-dependent zinc metalloprotease FtsH [Clostridia bacterium]|nr:ATP-dependent zinc metalloprotease FtsH [Clostridia bacterium]